VFVYLSNSFFFVKTSVFSVARNGDCLRSIVVAPKSMRHAADWLRSVAIHSLSDVPGENRDRAARFWDAWIALQRPRSDLQTLADLILVLGWTTGTEFRLASEESRSRVVDWREVLGDREWVRSTLIRLRHHWQAAVKRLVDEGLPEFAVLRDTSPERPDFPDLFCAVRLGLNEVAFGDALATPGEVGLWVRPLLNGAGSREALIALERRFASAFDGEKPRMAIVIAAAQDADAALRWIDLADAADIGKRDRFAGRVISSGAIQCRPEIQLRAAVTKWSRLDQSLADAALDLLLNGVKSGFCADSIAAGVTLFPQRSGPKIGKHKPEVAFPTERFRAIRARLHTALGRYPNYTLRRVWMAWLVRPAFTPLLESLPLPTMTSLQMRRALELLSYAANESDRYWRRVLSVFDEAIALLGELDEDDGYDLDLWMHHFFAWPETEDWHVLWRVAMEIAARHQRMKLELDCNTTEFWRLVLRHSGTSDRNEVRALPDSAFRHVGKAMRSENRASLITTALFYAGGTLGAHMPTLLRHNAGALMDTLQVLAILRFDQQKVALARFCEHPVYDADPLLMSPRNAVTLADAVADGGSFNPVPERLRAHLSGKRPQCDLVVGRDLAELAKGFSRLRIEALRGEISRELSRMGVGDAESGGQVRSVSWHTVALANGIDRNRRQLRRFLSRYVSHPDPRNYLESHPVNRRWLRRLREGRAGASLWETGFRLTSVVTPHGVVTLSFESDPEEILRMGTYASSCLGLGGCNSYSTVAVLLDANKRVIYARDIGGRVVARQLVAVSQDWELLVFRVYPKEENPEMSRLFHEFDRRLAARLGLPIHHPGEIGRDYRVEPLLCRNWYDDGIVPVTL
jgi:hypothetical protein